MVNGGEVLGRRTNLHDLQVVLRFEHAMADGRWLQHALAGFHPKRGTLALIEQSHAASDAEYHLEPYVVIVHKVRDLHALAWNANVRRNEAAAQSARDEVTVEHARTTCGEPCTGSREHHG